jgi:hypothetical protein
VGKRKGDWGRSLTRDEAAIVRRRPRIEVCPLASIERESTIGGKSEEGEKRFRKRREGLFNIEV